MTLTSVTIGAPDPIALAGFYARLLGWTITTVEPATPGEPPNGHWAQLRPPSGSPGPRLNFEFEVDYVPPSWPSVAGKPQIQEHLDIAVEDLVSAVEWAVDSGAVLALHQPQEHVRVLFDPAGHPFCLFLTAAS